MSGEMVLQECPNQSGRCAMEDCKDPTALEGRQQREGKQEARRLAEQRRAMHEFERQHEEAREAVASVLLTQREQSVSYAAERAAATREWVERETPAATIKGQLRQKSPLVFV